MNTDVKNLMPLCALANLAMDDMDRKTRRFVERRMNAGRFQIWNIDGGRWLVVPKAGKWLKVTVVPDATMAHLERTGMLVPVGDA